jgi:hypothetical protein
MSGFVAVIQDAVGAQSADATCGAVVGELSKVGSRRTYALPRLADAAAVTLVDVETLAQRAERSSTGTTGLVAASIDTPVPNAIQSGDVYVAWVGNPTWNGRPLTAEAIRGACDSEQAVQFWGAQLRGNFQVYLHHRGLDVHAFIADRASTYPLYFTSCQGCVTSPEPLSFAGLVPFGWVPRLRSEAVYEYFACGYLLRDAGWWQDVTRLGPGKVLWVERGRPRVFAYWELRIEPARKSTDELRSDLIEAIAVDSRSIPEGRAILSLSGGYDSRALLGIMHRAGRDFEAVSFNFGDEFDAEWDNSVGAYFARKLGVRHTMHVVPPPAADLIISQLSAAVDATGGEDDTVLTQDAFLGESFYGGLAGRFDYLLRGDECWGWGDYVLTRQMALWQVMLVELNQLPQPRRLLTPTAFADGDRHLRSIHQQCLAEAPPSSGPNDIKDFLYWRQREARILQNMTQYRRMFFPHYAPFLFGSALDVVRRLPTTWRCRKAMFRRAMEHEFPELFLDEKMPSSLTPRVSRLDRFFQSTELREFTRDALIDNPPALLAERFDRANFERWFDAVVAPRKGKDQSSRKHDSRRWVYDLLRTNRYLLAATTATLAATGRLTAPSLDNTYLFRLLGLSLALRAYEQRIGSAQRNCGQSHLQGR